MYRVAGRVVAFSITGWLFCGQPVLASDGGNAAAGFPCCSATGGRAYLAGATETASATVTPGAASDTPAGGTGTTHEGMVWIPGGEFSMGSTDPLARKDEAPVHRIRVDGFWMDATEVTNAQFARFVKATGYMTVAERKVDWEELQQQMPAGTPRPPDEMLAPGALVFSPPDHPVDTRDYARWWRWTPGANWRHPQGPGSTIEGHENFPVVQIAYEDARRYAAWAGKRLPTESEWEFAARGGLNGKVNVWGDEPISPRRANTWQGHFPDHNTADDGFTRAAPVASFPANGYGLYDMAGNVWEWCSEIYDADAYSRPRQAVRAAAGVAAPGPGRRVQRGGSFLCNDSYCASYRPSARMPGAEDTGAEHVGFRCVMTTH